MVKNITFVILILIQFVLAQNFPSIAVMDLDAKGIAKDEASVLTDKLRGQLFQTGRFQVIERSVMDEILKEQGFQQTGCTSKECAVEAGQLIGVQYIVAGSIGRIEKTYLLSVRLINVATGKIEKNVQKEQTGSLTDVLKNGIPYVVKELTKTFTEIGREPGESPDESKKPVREDKGAGKGFFRRGKTVISLSYARSISGIRYENNDASPALHDEANQNSNGFTLAVGKRIGYHHLGVGFTFSLKSSLVLENNDHTFERMLLGGNIEYYFERLKVRDIFILAPGVTLGYWGLKDHGIYVDESTKTCDPFFNLFGGPQARMELGWQQVHFFAAYTLLIIGGTTEFGTVTWKESGSNYEEGTYSIDTILNLLNFGVSFQF